MVSEVSFSNVIPASTLAAAVAGDTMAFARIVRAHHDDMARVCQTICGDPDLAQDAVQAAWPIAWRKLSTLRDPDRLRAWLVTVAANEARQMLRRRGHRRVVTIEIADVPSSSTDPAMHLDNADILAAVRLLPADERTLLAMRYVAGFDATEIARALGISPSGVRTRLSRLVARLRTELGDD